ncbi:MAG TPA: class I SAM-dependent methyltransferase [Pyrinomonadaceae bacterium]|nr:class I SAM-dependent methyltransferase [Pyrinomonadaceae bacterium]
MSVRTYDDIAPRYDAAMRPLDRWFLARLRETTLNYLPADARILELGAGTGLNFVYYPDNALGIATEPNAEMIKIAGEKARPRGVGLLQSSAEELPFATGSFDAAFATLVFCSVSRPDQAFSEIRRVVKAGGTVVLLEHVRPANLLGPLFDLLNLITQPLFDDHFNRRTSELARRAGLNVLRVEKSLLGIINLIVCRV